MLAVAPHAGEVDTSGQLVDEALIHRHLPKGCLVGVLGAGGMVAHPIVVAGSDEHHSINLAALELMISVGRCLTGVAVTSVGADQAQQLAFEQRLLDVGEITVQRAG